MASLRLADRAERCVCAIHEIVPGTAVNAPARAMVSRMKRRFSIARSCRGWGEDMDGNLDAGAESVKYFVL